MISRRAMVGGVIIAAWLGGIGLLVRREYFRPRAETPVTKDRQRWLVKFKGTEFFVNVDRTIDPDLGQFVEIKSRTWSRRDAEHKAKLTSELLDVLGLAGNETVTSDYIDVVDPAR